MKKMSGYQLATGAPGGRPHIIAKGLLICLLGAALLQLYAHPKPASAEVLDARLELAAGDIQVEVGSSSRRAFTGEAIVDGSHIKAGEGARALLRLSDGAAVFLRGGTRISLNGSKVSLEKGEFWLDAPPAEGKPGVHKLGDIEVAASDAGLSIKREGTEATIYVARGLATVTSKGGRVDVQAGEQAIIRGNAAPVVSPVVWWNDWTGGMADHPAASTAAGAGTLYGVDLAAGAGAQARPLEIRRQSVHAYVRSGFAETEVDQTFFNAGDRPVEGWYWFSVPQGASVTGFTLETNGVLVEGELIERREAAAQYGQAVATGHAPALLEWIDARTYRARIYPVPAGGTRRVIVRYLELLPIVGEKLRYVYPMQTQRPVRIGEFSLTVDLGAAGKDMKISTLAEALVEDNGRVVTMRRSGFTPRADFQLEGAPRKKRPPPVTLARFEAGEDAADYLMLRYMPDLDWDAYEAPPDEVVVVVDTSAAGDDASRQLKATAAEALVRALSSSDRFAVISLDIRPTVLYPKEGLADATEEEVDKALEALAEHTAGGATDLGAMFDVALSRLHGGVQPAIVYIGDGIATSGDTSAERLIERVRRALSTSSARLFCMGTGSDADFQLLQALARVGGGQAYAVEGPERITDRALRLVAALKAPTITDLEIDVGAGLDEVFTNANGKLTRGDEVVLLARAHHELPPTVDVRGRIAGKDFDRRYKVYRDRSVAKCLVPSLWAAEYVTRLLGSADDPEIIRGKVTSIGLEYGLMTPYTSFLALESELAYQQQGIPRVRGGVRGVRLSSEASSDYAATGVPADRSIAFEAASGEMWDEDAAPTEVVDIAESMPGRSRGPGIGKVFSGAKREAKSAPPPMAPAAEKAPQPSSRRNYEDTDMLDAPMGGAATGAARGGAVARSASSSQPVPDYGDRVSITRPVRRIAVKPRACSDLAERPLGERAAIWRKRLKTAQNPYELLERLEAARAACELSDWRAESLFLRLLARYIHDEGTATVILTHLVTRPDAQRYLARRVLRRAVDEQLVAAIEQILFNGVVNWKKLDLELSEIADPEERLARLRKAITLAPDDPEGMIRLAKLLVATGRTEEAVQLGRRFAERGLMTPRMARQLGDLLARQGLEDDAVRAYSEIVEFDPNSSASRKLLGDIYLAHGWYGPAYSQYKVLTEQDPRDSLVWLRLASAAAGASRIDEALRIERSVAESDGTPGPSDPRRFARLCSAARLAQLLTDPPKGVAGASGQELLESVTRKLKELQLFRGPGVLVVLTWEDLSADLQLATSTEGADGALGEQTDASAVGLSAAMLTPSPSAGEGLEARLRSVPLDRPLSLVRHEIRFDGKGFKVDLKTVELPPGATAVPL